MKMFIGYLKTGGGGPSEPPLNSLDSHQVSNYMLPWTNFKNKIASPISKKNDVFDRKNTDIIIIVSITL